MGRRPRRPTLHDDEAGSFMVLEAILVALIILTAILFFTSVQRPTTGADSGGLDLAQVAGDTLAILQVRTLAATGGSPNPGPSLAFDQWMANLVAGDATTATAVDSFLRQTLPAGTRYSLRLDNGISNLTLLPTGSALTPHGARAAEVLFLPNWAQYQAQSGSVTVVVFPGQVLDASHAGYPLVDPSGVRVCYQAPNGSTVLVDGSDSGTVADTWASRWKATPGSMASKATTGQVPTDTPLGIWRISSSATDLTNGQCSTSPIYVHVVRSDCLATPTAASCSTQYAPYGLELVVWYGA